MQISIVIPVKNCSIMLDSCLESFYPINNKLGEIIIMDCCSVDGIYPVIESHKFLPIKHIRGHDLGIYDAFNKGISVANFPIVFFLGADDSINRDIYDAVNHFDEETDILVGRITKGAMVEQWTPWLAGIHLLFRNIPHQAMLFRKHVLIERPYSLKYPILSDYAWNIQNFWSTSLNIKYTSLVFSDWNQTGISNTSVDFIFKRDKSGLISTNSPIKVRVVYFLCKLPSKILSHCSILIKTLKMK